MSAQTAALFVRNYSRTPLIRTSNYPDRLGPSAKHLLAALIALHGLWLKRFSVFSNAHNKSRVHILFARKQICNLKQQFLEFFFHFKLPI
jgi:hypothetical protein